MGNSENPLLDTKWHQKINPYLVFMLSKAGATYNVIVDKLTSEVPYVHPVDVQLLLAGLVRDGLLNAENGVYYLNHNEENDVFFEECQNEV